jgi:hypothetical protein
MDESLLVSEQDYAEAFQIVFNAYGKHNPTSSLQISSILDHHGPTGGCFGGLIDIATKRALVNG